jgi:hypothetical protein
MTARKPGGSDHAAGANGNGKTARRSYIAGIGASGALLAGAVVTFVFLVGTVSFEVWPEASERDSGTESLGVAELSGPGPAAGASAATLGEAVTILASSVPSVDAPSSPKAQPGLKGGDDGDSDGDGGAPVTPAPVGDGDGGTAGDPGDGSGGGSGGDNAPSDRPTNRPPSGGTGGGSTGGGTTSTPPTAPSGGGSNAPSDRPSGGRG